MWNDVPGQWRWFHETMLDCCVRLDVVKDEGVTFGQFICLATCNGCSFDMSQRVNLNCPPSSQQAIHQFEPMLEKLEHKESTGCCKGKHEECRTIREATSNGPSTDLSIIDFKENYFNQHVDKVCCFLSNVDLENRE